MKTINVAEIFGPTIQGEGPKAGIKTLFVRVVGCDFNCSWCDSKFAWKESETSKTYTEIELAEVLKDMCYSTDTFNIVLTGGNPCLYDFTYVINELKKEHIKIDVETQGSKFPQWLIDVDTLVFSPKAPSSGQPDVIHDIFDWIYNNYSLSYENPKIAIKIPVFNDEDFEFAMNYYRCINSSNLAALGVKLYLSVGNDDTEEDGDISARILSNYKKLIEKTMDSEMRNVYILPQLHTLVWGNRQGV